MVLSLFRFLSHESKCEKLQACYKAKRQSGNGLTAAHILEKAAVIDDDDPNLKQYQPGKNPKCWWVGEGRPGSQRPPLHTSNCLRPKWLAHWPGIHTYMDPHAPPDNSMCAIFVSELSELLS